MIRAWVKLIWNSSGVAAIAAAAQLAIAQALGIIRWDATYPADDASGWSALLTWIAFIYAVAVLGGAAIGRRALRRPTKPDTMPARIAAVLSAGVGASIAVGLAVLPAMAAKPPVSVHPELLVAMTAGTAIVAGVVIALVALSVPPVAGGVRAGVAWIWLVGIFSALAGYFTHRPYAAPRLAVIDAPSVIPVAWWSGPYLMIALAAVLGAGVAALARWAEARRFGIAISGFAGPAVVAAAYLIAGPGAGPSQLDPFRAALIAVLVGLIASVIVALPAMREPSGRDRFSSDEQGLDYRAGRAGRQASYEEGFTASGREPAGRSEPRPLLDEPYEMENYPQEPAPGYSPAPVYGQAPYEAGQHDGAQYDASQYDPAQRDSTQYDGAQYDVAQYDGAAATASTQVPSGAPVPPTAPAPPAAAAPPAAPAKPGKPAKGKAKASSADAARPAAMMGQPPARTYEEDYSDWLRDLGHVPGQRESTDREDQRT